ncbi:hypothetical protein SECTIM467_59 [Brevibacillus phage SecTim467]|uniref:Uncharacterized protein n=2 Tax=Jenstvirus jenst TaxID=1982225 RepID=A0A0K2CP08_9CAUD|nr:hypothetical protein AVV11_gp132 [Brevibacillus phage Jenst]ALA07308.1 hypothetical protein JENST_59 [Brevibacillus phage Jenst]ALA07562.1 hypothetical protein SECTIM467_59 [Brevibacillus phage SecTim467]
MGNFILKLKTDVWASCDVNSLKCRPENLTDHDYM